MLWGFFPLYWLMLRHVDARELVAHRILWSFALLLLIVPAAMSRGVWGGWSAVLAQMASPKQWTSVVLAASMIAINWLAFVYAATHGQILNASLGYYINPLFNVLLGVLFLSERLRWQQWLAIGLAAIGVAVMTVASGGLPWPALAMATSFAVYGLLKQKSQLPVLAGLFLETLVLVVPTLLYLFWLESQGSGQFLSQGWQTRTLMIGGGIVTVLPLALFAMASQRIALSTMGVLQYVGPTLQLLVGSSIAGEAFGWDRVVGFFFVWCGIVIFMWNLHRQSRKPSDIPPVVPRSPSPPAESPVRGTMELPVGDPESQRVDQSRSRRSVGELDAR